MDNLRWILLLSGIFLIIGIFTWEMFRRRHPEWDDPGDNADQSFETEGDGLFGEPAKDRHAQRDDSGGPANTVSRRDANVEMGDLADVRRQAPQGIAAPRVERSVVHAPAIPGDAAPSTNQPDEPLICAIAVTAKPGHRFSGDRICEALEAFGLHYGTMGIFHRYGPGEELNREPVFSAANMLEPGSFDLGAIDSLYTPGLMLFMRLPGEMDGTEAFDLMLTTGKQLAERLGGELRDETRSSLTPQSISHMRERIIDFGRRRLLVSH
jgi:cell division protein ZipA